MKKKVGTVVRAQAKINLYLDVTARSENGYHKIESVMQSVSLCDRVTVSAARGGDEIRVSCNLPYVPCDGRNIAYKAARAFLDECGINAGVRITIDKRIPVAGGMAGGSTDAAAVLSALNRVLGSPLGRERLYALAESLGADVPFCLSGGTALCRALESGDASAAAANLYNIFEDVILPQRKQASEAKQMLTACGALRAMMSGSGPTVFGLFESVAARDEAAHILTKRGFRAKKAEISHRKVQK